MASSESMADVDATLERHSTGDEHALGCSMFDISGDDEEMSFENQATDPFSLPDDVWQLAPSAGLACAACGIASSVTPSRSTAELKKNWPQRRAGRKARLSSERNQSAAALVTPKYSGTAYDSLSFLTNADVFQLLLVSRRTAYNLCMLLRDSSRVTTSSSSYRAVADHSIGLCGA